MYESVAGIFDFIYPHCEYKGRLNELVTTIRAKQANQTKTTVLDICCGSGRGLSLFDDFDNVELAGVDINPVLIEAAQRNHPSAQLYCHDALMLNETPLTFNKFDVITITGVSIHHFNPIQRQIIYGHIYALLRNGGILLLDILADNAVYDGVFLKTKIEVDNTLVLFDRYSVNGRYFHRNIVISNSGTPSVVFDQFEYYRISDNTLIDEIRDLKFKGHIHTDYINSKFLCFEKIAI